MEIIIKVKETSSLSRAKDFINHIESLKRSKCPNEKGYDDVIESIDVEWNT